MRAIASLFVAALLAWATTACGQTRKCKEGTVLLNVVLQGAATTVDAIEVQLANSNGVQAFGSVPHKPGSPGGTIEISFANGYPAGQSLALTVTGRAAGVVVRTATVNVTLDASCSRLDVELNDAAGGDGGVDAPSSIDDGGGVDGSAVDRMSIGDVILPSGDGGSCPGACQPGQEVPCGKCGKRTCTSDCVWSECSGEGLCAAGESKPCANCGTQFCNTQCQWSECNGGKACNAGDTEACGNCGLRSCGTTCEWGLCENDGACSPGQQQACGKCGVRKCSAGTSSCGWGECEDEGVCSPGAREACGNCGYKTCLDNCSWSACTNEGECASGTTRTCGNCGRETCSSSCQWEGVCAGQGICSPGEEASCGKCGDGVTICSSSCTWSSCRGGSTICCFVQAVTEPITEQTQAIICPY